VSTPSCSSKLEKFPGEGSGPRILQHAFRLGREHLGLAQTAILRRLAQFPIGNRRPEEVAEARGELPRGKRQITAGVGCVRQGFRSGQGLGLEEEMR